MSIHELIKPFSQVELTDANTLFGEKHEALPLIKIETEVCRAIIAIQGAHLIEFEVKGKAPLLWVSPKVAYKQNKAIRGGVPICFPWFGENQFDKSKPSHGFVRASNWQLKEVQASDQSAKLKFAFSSNEQTKALYPYDFDAEYTISLSDKVELELSCKNLSSEIMPVSFALHSYHPIEDLATVSVTGLHNTTFLDNTMNYQAHIQQGPVTFPSEIDRIYLNVASEQVIQTATPIALRSDSCNSAIVWNPGPAKAASMNDLGEENYTRFVCVERGNAFANSWYLQPAESKSAKLDICYA
ncbi:D-hexose-6-phosphate mutarotase [Catenovulum sediminis]|uniref:Putative glucose-6-phosphate 1-epimerase n=1 Tax=Catenovulum sediminis TaxID=1740262 RepID=A0ABV1RH51_9ALTE|nr:D-hexose-6-phosphate mutarotase [Catenovulum sediminis]